MSNLEEGGRTPEEQQAQSRCQQLRRLCLDPRTLRLKLLYVTLFAGVVVVWVQLGPYQKSLGLTEGDTGVMSIVGSSMILVGPLLTGVWADALGDFRVRADALRDFRVRADALGDFRRLMAATALLNGMVAFGFTLVPPAPLIGNVFLKNNSSANLCAETLYSSGNNLSGLHHSTDLDQSLNLNKSKLSQGFNLDELSSLKSRLTNDTVLTTYFLRPNNNDSDTVVVLRNNTSYYTLHNASSVHYNLPDAEVGSLHTLNKKNDLSKKNDLEGPTLQAETEDRGRSISTTEKLAAKSTGKISRCVNGKRTAEETENARKKAVTYWTYLALHASFMFLNSATISLFESGVLAVVSEHDINYGHQRCFASISATISAPIGGVLVDLTGSRDDKSNYRTVLYTSCSLMVLSSGLLLSVDMSFKKSAVASFKNLTAVFANVRLLVLFFVTFLSGVLMGYGETFVYRYLHGLGASGSLLGATVTVGGCFEGILMVCLSYILTFTGIYVCFVAGFLCFSLKFLGLYVLQNPVFALPLEALDSISTGMFMAVASLHMTSLVPCEALASMKGLLGTIYMGVGKMTGAAVGTAIVDAYGTRVSWAIMAGAAFTIAFLLAFSVMVVRSLNKSESLMKNSKDGPQTEYAD
ncbi:Major facilitator superfamily associated domain [Trinorchestia longiramus]|nr:Major facilitator superfamily associated domain [Trinorchestia longiramus]